MVALWAEEQQPMGGSSQTFKTIPKDGAGFTVFSYVTMSEMYRVTPFSETTSIQKYSMKNFFWMANPFHYIEYFSKLLHIVYNKMQFSSKIVLLESWKRVKFMTWKKYYSIREKYDWTVGRKNKKTDERKNDSLSK